MGLTTVFNASGVDIKKFLNYTEEKKATYNDWDRAWPQVRYKYKSKIYYYEIPDQ